MARGRIRLRTKVSEAYVLPSELLSREIAFGNYEKALYVKDADGDMGAYLQVDDVGIVSVWRSWSSSKIRAEIDLMGSSGSAHDHDSRYYRISQVDVIASGKSDVGHTHDSRYYTETEMDSLLDDKADKVSGAVAGNLVILTADGNIADSGFDETTINPDLYKSDILDFTEGDYVHTTDAESVGGLKTFTTIPRIPITDPTLDPETISFKWLETRVEYIDGSTY